MKSFGLKSALWGAGLALLAAGTGLAGGAPDPDWPCIQRRQPQLSVGQLWGGPPPGPKTEAQQSDPEVQRISQVIALRRTDMKEAEKIIADFAAGHDADGQIALFLATFDHIQNQRGRVMAGITRYAHSQEALDAKIKDLRLQFATLSAAKDPDFDRIDQIEMEIDWSTRIFQDRQQSLTYVCETPVILEQRAFALGRLIAAGLKSQP